MKHLTFTALLMAASLAAAVSCARPGAKTSAPALTPAQQLAARLDSVSDAGKTLFGHHDDPVYGHAWKYEAGRSDVRETAGDYPAVMSWDLGMLEMGDTANLDGVPFSLMVREAVAQAAAGGVNTFSWHPRNPVTGGDSWDCSDSTVGAKILSDTAVGARYDEWCASLATFFNSLTDSAGARIPVIFRPWHEHTGSWFWWGRKFCTPEQYIRLWTRMRGIFDREGVDNVLWAYSPDRVATLEDYMERYPGDEYVDIMGTDIYHFNGEEGLDEFRNVLTTSLAVASQAAAGHSKLLALTETGSEGIPMDHWWTAVLLPLIRPFGPAYVVVWRNAHDKPGHFFAPFPGHASASDFKTFTSDTTIFLRNEFAKYVFTEN